MTREIEERLRAALQAKADQVTPDTLSPARLPAAAPRRVGRWVVPTLVVAAGLAAVLAGGAVVTPRLLTSSTQPAGHPTVTEPATPTRASAPPVTGAPPSRTTPPAGGGTGSGSGGGSGGGSGSGGSGGGSGSGSGAGSRQADFDGVGLPVPAGWQLTTVDIGNGIQVGCVIRSGVAPPTDLHRCALEIHTQRFGDPDNGLIDADGISGYRDVRTDMLCSPGSGTLRAGERRAVTVGGRSGQYRTIVLDCPGVEYVVQQWVFTDEPGVVMIRWHAGQAPAEDLLIRQMIDGTTLPGGTGKRLDDFGHIVGVQEDANGTTITFDRAVPRSLWSAADLNDNPQTYQLRLAPTVSIRSAEVLCGDPALVTGPDGLAANPCSLATLRSRLTQPDTAASARTAYVWLRYDQAGQVTSITEDFRS